MSKKGKKITKAKNEEADSPWADLLLNEKIIFDNNKKWFWFNRDTCDYVEIDETDVQRLARKHSKSDKIVKNKQQFLDEVKIQAREDIPSPLPTNYVQFGKYLYDLKSDQKILSDGSYLSLNRIEIEPISNNNEGRNKVLGLLRDWLENENEVGYMVNCLASILIRDNKIATVGVWLYGHGSNGKTTLADDLIIALVGRKNYVATSIRRLGNTGNFDLAHLENKLVAVSSEGDNIEIKKTDSIKKIISGDAMDFEQKYKDTKTVVPYAKLWVACNSLPTTTDQSDGWYRRGQTFFLGRQFSVGVSPISKLSNADLSDFMLLLFEKAKEIYARGNIGITYGKSTQAEIIAEQRARYERFSNPFVEFFKNNIEVTENSNDTVFSYKLLEEFRKYAKSNTKLSEGAIIEQYDYAWLSKQMTPRGFTSEDIYVSKDALGNSKYNKGYRRVKLKKSQTSNPPRQNDENVESKSKTPPPSQTQLSRPEKQEGVLSSKHFQENNIYKDKEKTFGTPLPPTSLDDKIENGGIPSLDSIKLDFIESLCKVKQFTEQECFQLAIKHKVDLDFGRSKFQGAFNPISSSTFELVNPNKIAWGSSQ